MASRSRRAPLGRGLGALIQSSAPLPGQEPELGEGAPLHVALSRISPNPGQPRKTFREEEIERLAASIREQGVLQPLVVRAQGDRYELIIGERRWRAAQRAGLEEVPAVILDATDRGVMEMALVENIQRADLNPMELAQAFQALIDDEGMTQGAVGQRVGLDRSTVANHLRLLELPAEIQQDVIDQRLTMGHAKAILQAPETRRVIIRDEILRLGLSVRAAEEIGRRDASKSGSRRPRPGPSRDVHVAALEDRLREALQTKVRIVGRPEKGRVELHYFDVDELDRVTRKLLGESE